MSSICISTCVSDAMVPSNANYVTLSKCSEYSDDDDEKFSGIGRKQNRWINPKHSTTSSTCSRQVMYFRNAYTFSRKETTPSISAEKSTGISYFGKVRERVVTNYMTGRRALTRSFRPRRRRKTRVVLVKKVKEFSSDAFCSIFQKLLSCTATVDVVEQNDHRTGQ